MKALIVDPSASVRNIFSMMLRQYDIEVHEAVSGKDGLLQLKKSAFDLLMFAYELQDMDGLQFYEKCRAKSATRLQVSLLVTSSAQKGIAQHAIDAGVTACFSKLDFKALDRFIANLVKSTALKFKCHALLVEDSTTASMFYGEVLTNLGFTFDSCLDAETAILSIQNKNYDLVVVDFKLSGVGDGFTVIRAVRNLPEPKSSMPILAMSAFSSPTRRVQLLLNGANDFIAKSSSLEEFEIRVTNLVSNYKLLQKLESQHKAMQEMAMHDPLTKLYNRHYLEIIEQNIFSKAQANAEQLSLLVIDIDFFKKINDSHGHRVGDQVLEKMSQLLKAFFIHQPLIFRIGGEEFLVLLPQVGDREAYEQANQLCKQVEQANLQGLKVTASIGVATYDHNDNYERLFHRADLALSQAKQNGRNCVVTAFSIDSTIS